MKKVGVILAVFSSFLVGYLICNMRMCASDPFDEIANYSNYSQFEGYALFYRGGSIILAYNKDSIIVFDRQFFSWEKYKMRDTYGGHGSHVEFDKMVEDFVNLPITRLYVKNGNVFISMPISEKCTEHLAFIANRSELDTTLIKGFLPYRKRWLHYEKCND